MSCRERDADLQAAFLMNLLPVLMIDGVQSSDVLAFRPSSNPTGDFLCGSSQATVMDL